MHKQRPTANVLYWQGEVAIEIKEAHKHHLDIDNKPKTGKTQEHTITDSNGNPSTSS